MLRYRTHTLSRPWRLQPRLREMGFKEALRIQICTQALRVKLRSVCYEGVWECVRRSVSGGLKMQLVEAWSCCKHCSSSRWFSVIQLDFTLNQMQHAFTQMHTYTSLSHRVVVCEDLCFLCVFWILSPTLVSKLQWRLDTELPKDHLYPLLWHLLTWTFCP